jgi:hypothetical protein
MPPLRTYVSLAFAVLKNREGNVLGAMERARVLVEKSKSPQGEAG